MVIPTFRLISGLENTLSIFLDSVKPEKAIIVGKLTVAMAEGNISPEEFNNLCLIVHEASMPSIKALKEFAEQNQNMSTHIKPGVEESTRSKVALLLSIGVIVNHGTHFRLTEDGKNLYHYGMKNELENINVA